MAAGCECSREAVKLYTERRVAHGQARINEKKKKKPYNTWLVGEESGLVNNLSRAQVLMVPFFASNFGAQDVIPDSLDANGIHDP